jgi:hypothetical protein
MGLPRSMRLASFVVYLLKPNGWQEIRVIQFQLPPSSLAQLAQ